ncbi:MAG: hypothetical protein QNI96_11355 [Woeseiaceae bacterium]|nr:hypothetical protein [Woeseiaceae bacterium]
METAITRKRPLLSCALGITLLMGAACTNSEEAEQQDQAEPPVAVERPQEMTREERIAMRRELQVTQSMPADTVRQSSDQAPEGGVTGEVPEDLMDKIFADLEGRTGAQRAEFETLQAQAVQWNDGALGCPEPGQVYTQAIVDGFRVVLKHEGKTYDYHAAAKGFFKLCTGFRPNRSENPDM